MEKDVFICGYNINTIKVSLLTKKQLIINLCDAKGKEYEFSSSLISEIDFEKYQNNIFKALNANNWSQIIYSPPILNLTAITEGKKNTIVGLELETATIHKNEVTFF